MVSQHHRVDRRQHLFRRRAGGELRQHPPRPASSPRGSPRASFAGASPREHPLELGLLGRRAGRPERASHSARALAPLAPIASHAALSRRESSNGRLVPAIGRLGVGDQLGVGQRAMALGGVLRRRAQRDMRLAGDHRRARARPWRPSARGRCPPDHGRRSRTHPSPLAAKRAFWSVTSEIETLPSMVMPLLSHSTISVISCCLPASANRFLADALHQAAVARDDLGVVVLMTWPPSAPAGSPRQSQSPPHWQIP